jgi:hypothetical protein
MTPFSWHCKTRAARRLRARVALLSLTFLVLAGCGEDPGIDPAIILAGPATGEVQFVNLIPDAPELTIAVGTNAATVDYRDATVNQGLPLADYTMTVSFQGAAGETIVLFEDIPFRIDDENELKVLLRGTVANPSFHIQDLRDPKLVGQVAEGTQQVWVAGGLATTESYDVYVTDSRVQVSEVAPTLTVSGQGQTDLVTIDAAPEYRFRVTAAGSNEVLFDSGDFLLPRQTRAGFALIEYFGPARSGVAPTIDAIAFSPGGSQAFPNRELPSELRVVNLVRDTPAMDVYFGSTAGDPFAAGIAPLDVTPYRAIDSGRVSLNLTEPGVKDQFLLESDELIISGSFHTLLLRGRGALGALQTITYPQLPRAIRGRVPVTVINASDQLDVVRVELLAPGQDFRTTGSATDLGTGGIQGALLEPGDVDLVVLTLADVLIYGPERVSLEEGRFYTMILSEREVGGTVAADVITLVEDTVEPRTLSTL